MPRSTPDIPTIEPADTGVPAATEIAVRYE